VGSPSAAHVRPLEEQPRRTRTEARLRGDVDDHHLAAVTIEDLPAVARPDRLAAPLGRDRPPSAWARKRLHVDLEAAGFIGDIGQPATVGREGRGGFNKWRAQERLGLALAAE